MKGNDRKALETKSERNY